MAPNTLIPFVTSIRSRPSDIKDNDPKQNSSIPNNSISLKAKITVKYNYTSLYLWVCVQLVNVKHRMPSCAINNGAIPIASYQNGFRG